MNESYSSSEVCSAARVSYRQLDYWFHRGVLVPSVELGLGSGTQRRYDANDAVAAAVIRVLSPAGAAMPTGAQDAVAADGRYLVCPAAVERTSRPRIETVEDGPALLEALVDRGLIVVDLHELRAAVLERLPARRSAAA